MALSDRLRERIASEEAHIVRIQTDAAANIAQAEVRLTVLRSALSVLDRQPELEGLLTRLAAAGITVVE